jgi:hypothetical protein
VASRGLDIGVQVLSGLDDDVRDRSPLADLREDRVLAGFDIHPQSMMGAVGIPIAAVTPLGRHE